MSFSDRIIQWLFRRLNRMVGRDTHSNPGKKGMELIPIMEDRVQALKCFLKANEHDDTEITRDWAELMIRYHVNSLSPAECERLLNELPSWSEASLYHLAVVCLEMSNPALDYCYLYCLCFLAIGDNERLQSLIQDLATAVSNVRAGTQPCSFYDEMSGKVCQMIERAIESTWYERVLAVIAEKREHEAESAGCSTQ